MSEDRRSYGPIILFAIVLGALVVFVWVGGNANIVEKILIVVAVLFCLGLLIKQKWALIGVCITLLLAVLVYFSQAWLLPIVNEDTALIWPNVLKMLVSIVFLILLGRQSVEHRMP